VKNSLGSNWPERTPTLNIEWGQIDPKDNRRVNAIGLKNKEGLISERMFWCFDVYLHGKLVLGVVDGPHHGDDLLTQVRSDLRHLAAGQQGRRQHHPGVTLRRRPGNRRRDGAVNECVCVSVHERHAAWWWAALVSVFRSIEHVGKEHEQLLSCHSSSTPVSPDGRRSPGHSSPTTGCHYA